MMASGRNWLILLAIQDGVSKDAVALVLDGLPAFKELVEVLQDWRNLLLGEAETPHGLIRLLSLILVGNYGIP